MTPSASTTLDYTLAQLARLDLLIRREVLRLHQQQGPREDDEFRDLYVSPEEVDALLARSLAPAALLLPQVAASDSLTAIDAALSALTAQIAELAEASRTRGEVLRLDCLSQLFGLSALECEVLLICLAREIDLKYERLYAYLQDHVTKRQPTVDLVLRLLCPTLEARLAARSWFAPDAPLVRWHLVTLHDGPGAHHPVLLARYLKLDERIAGYLLGSDAIDPRLAPLVAAPLAAGLAAAPPRIARQLNAWAAAWTSRPTPRPPVFLLHGRYGTGKRAAARVLAEALGWPLLMLRTANLAGSELELSLGLHLAEREALLRGALLCWWEADRFTEPSPERTEEARLFVQALAQGQAPTALLTAKAWQPGPVLEQRPLLELELPEPTYSERRTHWTTTLNGAAAGLAEQEISALSGRFRFTLGQIQDALAQAHTLAWMRDPANGYPAAVDIDAACRAQVQHGLGAMARKLEPRYSWDDIVLPTEQLAALRLIGAMIRQRPVVYGDWGFDHKLVMGKGVIALFTGPSGTGKTMAAEIIAHDLGLDLYKIDLSAVVNKYIGETEKNLERIFQAAQQSDAILFFDEADALFGKRSEVKDAHDRYANIETAYLLQRTEEYDGLVILASNLKKNMDEAFVRRLHFAIDFPEPEERERLEIWRCTLPSAAPQADDLDLAFLARKLKMTGGNIRNVILMAAFLAAEDRAAIAMRHLIQAAASELQKMGRLVMESDFEHYFVLAKLE
jgi:AAA+ superfamily predicted ATPase